MIKGALVKATHAIINGLLSTRLMLIKGALVKANHAIISGLRSTRLMLIMDALVKAIKEWASFNKVNVDKGCPC